MEMHSSSDAFYEILTRVSLGNLMRQCKWVCKDWEKFTYETMFKLMHSQRTQTVSGYFIKSSERYDEYRYDFVTIVDHSPQIIPSPSLDFLPRNTKIVASSNDGILCCVNNSNHRHPIYYICKPTTHSWRMIPKPRTRFVTESMAMVVRQSYPELYCKIIRLSRPKKGPGYHCEIFSSKEWAWKRLSDITLPYCVFIKLGGGIYVKRGFHWLTTDDRVFVFYVEEQIWTTFRLPEEHEVIQKMNKKLIHFEGNIGVIFTSRNWMRLWILHDRQTNTWINKFNINLRWLHRKTKSRYSWVLDIYSNDIVLMRNNDEVIWYNCSNRTYITSRLPSKTTMIGEVYSFDSDLVPCSLRS
ncbi:F-box associated domain [Macleaya cordata]|uniref:F-box associated domain n=1 Tax=Macleaya cordata TaxID=56857 RepID=A0A200PNA7_MACCD|nr:F-box associated domain [Macleaya cordata]